MQIFPNYSEKYIKHAIRKHQNTKKLKKVEEMKWFRKF